MSVAGDGYTYSVLFPLIWIIYSRNISSSYPSNARMFLKKIYSKPTNDHAHRRTRQDIHNTNFRCAHSIEGN